ncbi:MAG: RiPP maturation radical SAM protein 1 [Ectothiorhodospiraceae bacterium]|nr:RiPP maturation radical SAM protein 1 [Ectothiorhodospiraceae bacterium]
MEVCLVSMPFVDLHRPSIALGLLKASLVARGIAVEVRYPAFDFAAAVGMVPYHRVMGLPVETLVGEWVFARAADPRAPMQANDYVERLLRYLAASEPSAGADLTATQWSAMLAALRESASRFVDGLADAIVAAAPRIVGCTSMFHQHCASIALLRAVRERDPSIVTVLGGANCEGPMAAATARIAPSVDLVVSGEADLLIGDLCEAVLRAPAGARPWRHPAVVARAARAVTLGVEPTARMPLPVGRAQVEDLAAVRVPDYDEYFAALGAFTHAGAVTPALAVETSRGCFWGEKSHCTFCGLNGAGMHFRSKAPERVVEELATLSARHHTTRFQVVDNILDMGYLDSVMPTLAELGAPYELFYEVLPNLRREQVTALADAGVRCIQPGIESLHDAALRALGKANSVTTNVQLLRWCRELGISVTWSVLHGIPGEADTWYRQMAELVPLLEHLQPPGGCVGIRFDRFSPYHQSPERFGLRLRPGRFYADVFAQPEAVLRDLAYYFETDVDPHAPAPRSGLDALREAVAHWRARWLDPRHAFAGFPVRPQLDLGDDGDGIDVRDTRGVAWRERYRVDGLGAEVLRACDRARGPVALAETIARRLGTAVTVGELEPVVAALTARRLIVESAGRLLTLGVWAPRRAMPGTWAGGWTDPSGGSARNHTGVAPGCGAA